MIKLAGKLVGLRKIRTGADGEPVPVGSPQVEVSIETFDETHTLMVTTADARELGQGMNEDFEIWLGVAGSMNRPAEKRTAPLAVTPDLKAEAYAFVEAQLAGGALGPVDIDRAVDLIPPIVNMLCTFINDQGAK